MLWHGVVCHLHLGAYVICIISNGDGCIVYFMCKYIQKVFQCYTHIYVRIYIRCSTVMFETLVSN